MSDKRAKISNPNDSGHSSSDDTEQGIIKPAKKKSRFIPKSDATQNISTISERPTSVTEGGKKDLASFLLKQNIEIDPEVQAKLTSLASGKVPFSSEENQTLVASDVDNNTLQQHSLEKSPLGQTKVDIDNYFKDQFISLLDSISLSDLPSSFNRHFPIKKVISMYGEEKALAYAAARGLALKKKAEQTPWEDTTKAFKNRYDVKVDRLWINDDADKDFIKVNVYIKNPTDGTQLPAYVRHCYENELNPIEGKFNLLVNYGERDNNFQLPGTDRLKMNHLLWHCRTEAIAELATWDIKVPNASPITELTLDHVINSEANDVWNLLIKPEFIKPEFSGIERVELKKPPVHRGSPKKEHLYYDAFIGTPVGQGALFFCEQYKHEIGNYEVKRIVIPNKEKDLQKVEFHFGPKSDE